MTRVKRGKIALKRRRSVLKAAKGFRGTRGTKEKLAKENLVKAGLHAFAHRRDKKNDFRRLWHVRLNAALKKHDLSYSKFAGTLKKQNILLNRKMLATIAHEHPAGFDRFIAQVTK
jgi:large subunit ribosomal protein L20